MESAGRNRACADGLVAAAIIYLALDGKRRSHTRPRAGRIAAREFACQQRCRTYGGCKVIAVCASLAAVPSRRSQMADSHVWTLIRPTPPVRQSVPKAQRLRN